MRQAPTVPVFRVIQLALLAGVVIFGLVIGYLTRSGGFQPDAEAAGVLRLVFLLLSLGSLAGIMAVRAALSRAAPDRQAMFAIVGWALGEGVALFGGVAWLVAGEMLLYLTGLGLLIVALLLIPVPTGT